MPIPLDPFTKEFYLEAVIEATFFSKPFEYANDRSRGVRVRVRVRARVRVRLEISQHHHWYAHSHLTSRIVHHTGCDGILPLGVWKSTSEEHAFMPHEPMLATPHT